MSPRTDDHLPRPASSGAGARIVRSGRTYHWEWLPETDLFRILDREGRTIVTGLLQPAVTVRRDTAPEARCTTGSVVSSDGEDDRLTVRYGHVNGDAAVALTVRFEPESIWLGPVRYETPEADDVVTVHYHASSTGSAAKPSLEHTHLVQPGISESSALSPVLPTATFRTGLKTWLGRGSTGSEYDVFQQWGLPAHYFCGVTRNADPASSDAQDARLSDAFCCGLAALPRADLFLHTEDGRSSQCLEVRSDLWGHVRGPGTLELGEVFVWAFARTYDAAARSYYLALADAGIVPRKRNSAAKNATVTAAQFNTWGAQCAEGRTYTRFDQPFLESVYDDVRQHGMRPGVFVIDDKWEGSYGSLEHDTDRFPDFERFLARVRADGSRLGLWVAFLRTDDPTGIGLEHRHLLHGVEGAPIVERNRDQEYSLLDVSQREVQDAVRERIATFCRRYRPDLVKFDFGYELPSLSVAAPADRACAGERFFESALDLVVGALRDANPDVVVMYYSLSPLLVRHIDLHSPDDLFLCAGDYDVEANRRFFFSRLLGDLGVPTYGSGGYDWRTMREIWFDSIVVGNVGSLGSFSRDELGQGPSAELVAKYNGLAAIARRSNVFTVDPLDPVRLSSAGGAHSSSWARYENGELVLAALRVPSTSSGPSHPLPFASNTSVVVASLSDAAIGRTAALGVVPFGAGTLVLRPPDAHSAEVATHVFAGRTRRRTAHMTNDRLQIELAERLDDGSIVEWVEIRYQERLPATAN